MRFKVGRKFIVDDEKTHLMIFWKDCRNEECESLRNSRPSWNCMTWRHIRRKKDLIITDWKRWWKEVSSKIYEIRTLAPEGGIYERNALVKNPGTKQRVQRILGNCWQWESNGQCSRGHSCSFRRDINKRGKMTLPNPSEIFHAAEWERCIEKLEVPEAKVPVVPCLDGPARITSKELAPECLLYKTKSGCRFGQKCSYAHRQVDEQPCKKSKKNDDKSAVAMLKKNVLHESVWQLVVNLDSHERSGRPDIKRDTCHDLKQAPTGRRSSNARQLGCVLQDMKPPKSI